MFHADTNLPLGATGAAQPPLPPLAAAPADGEIALAVVGAHLSGMPLNGEITALGARLLEQTTTAPDYRLFALNGSQPPKKPGLLRVAAGKGAPIAVELWALPTAMFGAFMAAVASPLSIGTLTLADGRAVKGFLVEAEAIAGAQDISSFGGWRAYVASTQ
jgi:allophanate hydrolase